MDFEFDKEMDALLRQAARGEPVSVSSNPKSEIRNPKSLHIDADEISLFAENVLPVKARARVVEHLADCNHCRKTLSEFIRLNADAEIETVQTIEVKTIAPAAIPWHKKLFAFPQTAFAMGALALVFSGVIAFLILQNGRETQNDSVAKFEKNQDAPQTSGGPNAPDTTGGNYAMSNSAATSNAASAYANSNAAAMSSNASVSNSSAKNTASNSSVAETNRAKQILAETETTSAPKPAASVAPENKSTAPATSENASGAADASAPMPAKRENSYQVDGVRAENETISRQADIAQNQAVQNQQNISPGAQNARRAPTQTVRAQNEKDRNVSTADEMRSDLKKAKTSEPTRTAGGKVFKFADGVWYDANYKNQRTTNVRRSSAEYKNLDANLRSIADGIGGTVVIVWKGAAYRIQ